MDLKRPAEALFALPASAAKGCTVGEIIVLPHLRDRHEAGMARQERTCSRAAPGTESPARRRHRVPGENPDP